MRRWVCGLLLLTWAGAVAACSPFGSDIDAVKAAATDGMRNEDFVAHLAGSDGSVEWSARRWKQYPKNSSIIFVEAAVERPTRAGGTHRIIVQYVYNRVSEQARLHDVLIDGISQGALAGALQMLMMRLE